MVKPESYGWLMRAAIQVNQVWSWAAATSADAADRNRRAGGRCLTGFDLCNLKLAWRVSGGTRLSLLWLIPWSRVRVREVLNERPPAFPWRLRSRSVLPRLRPHLFR